MQLLCPKCRVVLAVPAANRDCARCHRCGQRVRLAGVAAAEPLRLLAGRYEVQGELGQGASGVVYHACDRLLGRRDVAVKMLRPEVMENAEAVRRLQAEAEVMARIVHPNILPVLDHGPWEKRYLVVFPLVRGTTLREQIPPGGMADPRRAVSLAIQVARALHHVWSQHRILHRDVKPANILLVEGSQALYLMDFGLAACRDLDQAHATLDGTLLGTPAYMAPEQARGELATVGHQSDVYSVGAVLYQLLTGQVPFPAPYPAVLFDVREKQPRAPSRLRHDLDEKLDLLVLAALAKRPENRFATGQAFADALEGWLTAGQAAGRHRGARESKIGKRASLAVAAVQRPAQAAVQEAAESTQQRSPADTHIDQGRPPLPGRPAWLLGWLLVLGAVFALLLVGLWWAVRPPVRPVGQKPEWWGTK